MKIIKKEHHELENIIESLLFIHGDPISASDLRDIIDPTIHLSTIKKSLSNLIEKHNESNSGLCILQLEDRYQMGTNQKNTEYVNKLLSPRKKKSFSAALMETLTIIAYKQPVTKVEVEDLRGVKSDTIFAKLLDLNLIVSCGVSKRIGHPKLYETTDEFLKLFKISTLAELPDIETYSTNSKQCSFLD